MSRFGAHSDPRLRRGLLTALLATSPCAVLAAATSADHPSFLQGPGAQQPIVSRSAPVMLAAARMDYDREQDVVVASGNVEVTQGETVLLADKLTYSRAQNKVVAEGNVSVLEPSGNVYFAESAELVDEMKEGVIQDFRGRLADGSLFAAQEARKLNENRMQMTRAVYSPCSICASDGSPKTPLWQVRARDVTYDKAEQTITYNHAFFDVYGLPIAYTPYLSHAAPGADNKNGFLIPEYRHSNTLGTVVKVPYYWSIAPDRDTTFTPISTSREGVVLAGEYRQQFDQGGMQFSGSITNPTNRDAAGNQAPGHDLRGHLNATGNFTPAADTRWGFDIHRTTDDTYLRRYDFGSETYLTSRLYLEGMRFVGDAERNWGSIQGLAFQGLTARDNNRRIPLVLPLADFFYETDPLAYGSRFSLTGNALALTRKESNDTRRLLMKGKWRLPYITSDGQVIEFSSEVRGDAYQVNALPRTNATDFDGATGRLFPQAALHWRTPFIRHFNRASLILEPNVMLAAAPNQGNPERIPNEDSRFPEFTDANLFSTDRFPGYDRIEGGLRAAYGLRAQLQMDKGQNINALLGQNVRTHPTPYFPYSNDLNSHLSDYVGKLGFAYAPFDVAYRFRMDRDDLAARRQEVNAGFSYDRINLNASYLMLNDDPIVSSKQEIAGGGRLKIIEYWLLFANARRDLRLDRFASTSAGLEFQNECLTIDTVLSRDYTRDRDIVPGNSVIVRVHLKNLD